jgi:signal transduction histidine kinase
MTHRESQSTAIDWLICVLRWPVLGLALLIALLDPLHQADLPVVYVTLGAGVLLNLVIPAMLLMKWFPSPLPGLAITVDVILIAILLIATGGVNSPLFPLAIFPVLVGSIRFGLEAGLLATTPIVMALTVMALPEVISQGVVDPLFTLVMDMGLLIGTASLSGFLSDRQKRVVLETEEEELKGLRAEYDRARVIYEMVSTLSSTLNYQRVLEIMLDLGSLCVSKSDQYIKSVVSAIFLFEDSGGTQATRMRLVAGRNLPQADERRKVSSEAGLVAQAIYAAEPVIGADLADDPELGEFVALQHCHSAICAPLRAGFETYGVILFASPERNLFSKQHVEMLTNFCNQATIALQNAQLYQSVREEKEKLLNKEADTRKKLARDLHDGPTQAVAAIAMRLNFVRMLMGQDPGRVVEELQKIEELAHRTTEEIRIMLFTMRPLVLETKGLAAAIRQYADQLHHTEGLNIILDVDSYDGRLPPESESVIFSVVEEAIGNARKHARAEHIWIRLGVEGNEVLAEIRDDGAGFDVKAVESSYAQRGSLGLINMRERAELVEGRVSIESALGQGTTVRLAVPVRRG